MAKGTGSIPGQETKIPCAAQYGQEKKKKGFLAWGKCLTNPGPSPAP